MKRALATILAVASFNLFAETSGKVLFAHGTQIPYLSKISADGTQTAVTIDSVFVGERVFKQDDGACLKETTLLVSMRTVPNVTASKELNMAWPEMNKTSVEVTCPG